MKILVLVLLGFSFTGDLVFAQVRRRPPVSGEYRRDNSTGLSRPRICRQEISRGQPTDGQRDCSVGSDYPKGYPEGTRVCVNYSESLRRCLRWRR